MGYGVRLGPRNRADSRNHTPQPLKSLRQVSTKQKMDSATKDRIAKLITSVLGTFQKEYIKAYMIAMANAKIDEKMNKEEDPYQLLTRPTPDIALKEGWLLKEGAVRHNWKRRYFVVLPNWQVEYFVDETKKKRKGVVEAIGYTVNTDLGSAMIKRLEAVAEKAGIEVDQLPKPKSYPEGTFELYHASRRCWYFQPDKPEERDEWIQTFRTATMKCPSLTKDDSLHAVAFPKAARATRRSLGRWWVPRGTEVQVLTDIVADEIEWQVMGDVYVKLNKMPAIARNTARNKVKKAINTMVSKAAAPAWDAMWKMVQELKPKAEPKVDESVGPIAEQKAALRATMEEKTNAKIDEVLTEKCAPHTAKLCEIVRPGADGGLAKSNEVTKKALDEYVAQADAGDISKGLDDLDAKGVRGSDLHEARADIRSLYDPLWALNTVFKDIRPWSVIGKGEDHVRQLNDRALYTFRAELESKCAEGSKKVEAADIEAAKASTLAKLQHDTEKARREFIADAMCDILLPPIQMVINPAVKEILAPMGDTLPDAVKEFIDPEDEFDLLLESMVRNQIDKALSDLGSPQPQSTTSAPTATSTSTEPAKDEEDAAPAEEEDAAPAEEEEAAPAEEEEAAPAEEEEAAPAEEEAAPADEQEAKPAEEEAAEDEDAEKEQ